MTTRGPGSRVWTALAIAAGVSLGLFGDTAAALADGDVTVTVTRRTIRIAGDANANDIQVSYSPGEDTLLVTGRNDTTVGGEPSMEVTPGTRSILIDLRDGDDVVDHAGGAPRNLTVRLGGGDDMLALLAGRDATYAGRVRIDGGAGGSTVDATGTFRKAFGFRGGDGVDTIEIAASAFEGPVVLDGRGDDDSLTITGCTATKKITQRGGVGADTLVVQQGPMGLGAVQAVTMIGGAGDERIAFGGIGGRLIILGGSGADTVESSTDGPQTLGDRLIMNLGSGNDAVTLFETNVTRQVTLRTGPDDDSVNLNDCFLDSSFTFVGGGGNDDCFVNGGVVGAARFLGGGGNDEMGASGCVLGATLTVVGGGGNDLVACEFSEVAGRALLIGGRGEDGVSAIRSTFDGPVLFDGGPGQDTINGGEQEDAMNRFDAGVTTRSLEIEVLG